MAVNGGRARPSRELHPGDRLIVRRGEETFEVVVKGLESRRGPARTAVLLYEETEESQRRRGEEAQRRKLQPRVEVLPGGRPTKRDRRRLERM